MTAEQDILRAAARRAQALASGDADELRSTLHASFVWTSHKGDVFDRDRYVKANTGSGLQWLQQQLLDPKVRVAGGTAVLTATVLDEVMAHGEAKRFRMPVTQTWIMTENGWLCLSGHAGPIEPEEP